MSSLRLREAVLVLSLIGATPACEPPPRAGDELGRVQLGLVLDAAVFKVIQVFQVHVVKATTTSGASVTCQDIPANYKTGDSSLVPIDGTPKSISWSGDTKEARVESFEVPADERLVFVAKGLAQYAQGVQTVAVGCQDNLTFKAGAKQELSIDVRATTGAACNGQPECENGLFCQKGEGFSGGYCAKYPCGGDQDCPPGTHCVNDPDSGGLCLRACESPADCNTSPPQSQDCVGRAGPSGAGCPTVCVYPLWNKTGKCGAN